MRTPRPASGAFAALVFVVEYIESNASGRIHRGIVRRVSLTSASGRATSERYIVPEPSVPDLPATVLECSESAYMTPAPTLYRVRKGA